MKVHLIAMMPSSNGKIAVGSANIKVIQSNHLKNYELQQWNL